MAVVTNLVVGALNSPYHGPYNLETGHKIAYGVVSFGTGDQYSATTGIPADFATNLGIDRAEHIIPMNAASWEDDVSVATGVTIKLDVDLQAFRLYQCVSNSDEIQTNDVIQDLYFEIMVLGR